MPKFNQGLQKKQTSLAQKGHDALNRAGGLAYQDSVRMALYRQVATSLWSGDGYYETEAEWFARFQRNVAQVCTEDVHFPFSLAAYARDKSGLALRTSAIALFVEALSTPEARGTGLARKYAKNVLARADEPAEAIAYYRSHHDGPLPHGLLKAIADVLPAFDEFQLARYKKTGAVSLRDVFRLARPKPESDEQRQLWNRVVTNKLKAPYTWEVELSKTKTDEAKCLTWNELISSGRLGLFALVRNLRNILKYRADIENALSQITRESVLGSGILPFQWYKAYHAVASVAGETIARPLEQALEWSTSEIPHLPGVTLVACDNSGSMASISGTRGMTNAEIANLMGALALFISDKGLCGTFGDTFALAPTDETFNIFFNKEQIDRTGATTGWSTNAWKVFEFLIQKQMKVDRVIIFSDMQCYDSDARYLPGALVSHSLSAELYAYRVIHPQVKIYSVNLASQDNSCQFTPQQPVVELAGWSESIFHFIQAMEVTEPVLDTILDRYRC